MLDCKFIIIIPDEKDFTLLKVIYKIHRHIKKLSKGSLIDKISKRLFRLEFKSNHWIKSRALEYVVNNIIRNLWVK